ENCEIFHRQCGGGQAVHGGEAEAEQIWGAGHAVGVLSRFARLNQQERLGGGGSPACGGGGGRGAFEAPPSRSDASTYPICGGGARGAGVGPASRRHAPADPICGGVRPCSFAWRAVGGTSGSPAALRVG